jgi:hypothetical protein
MDPERLARSRLIQSLAGAAGRSTAGSALAGLALTGENVAARQDAERRAHMLENQGYGEKIMGLDMAARKGGLEALNKEADRQARMAEHGIAALGSMGSAMEARRATETQAAASHHANLLKNFTDVRNNEATMANNFAIHKLDREASIQVAHISAQAHADLAAATREATTESKRQEAIARFMKVQNDAERVLVMRYETQIKEAEKRKTALAVMKQPTDKVEAEIELLNAGMNRDRQAIIKQTQDALSQVGAGSSGKWGDVTTRPSK